MIQDSELIQAKKHLNPYLYYYNPYDDQTDDLDYYSKCYVNSIKAIESNLEAKQIIFYLIENDLTSLDKIKHRHFNCHTLSYDYFSKSFDMFKLGLYYKVDLPTMNEDNKSCCIC